MLIILGGEVAEDNLEVIVDNAQRISVPRRKHRSRNSPRCGIDVASLSQSCCSSYGDQSEEE